MAHYTPNYLIRMDRIGTSRERREKTCVRIFYYPNHNSFGSGPDPLPTHVRRTNALISKERIKPEVKKEN